jgi:hypothetical protein
MDNFRTSRTHEEIVTFINAWMDGETTADTVRILRKKRSLWPYSVSTSSVSQFATKLRQNGVDLPRREPRSGYLVRVNALNSLIERRLS